MTVWISFFKSRGWWRSDVSRNTDRMQESERFKSYTHSKSRAVLQLKQIPGASFICSLLPT